jgi:hypothetical protein
MVLINWYSILDYARRYYLVMFEREFTTDKKKLNRIYIQKASDEELGWLKNAILCELLDRATKRKEVRPQS